VTKEKSWKGRNLHKAHLLPGFGVQRKEERINSEVILLAGSCAFHFKF